MLVAGAARCPDELRPVFRKRRSSCSSIQFGLVSVSSAREAVRYIDVQQIEALLIARLPLHRERGESGNHATRAR